MLEEVDDQIQVASLFKNGEIRPLKFLWKGREYAVQKINLSYARFEGRAKVYFFAVSDNTHFFKLQFNSDDLTWRVLEVYSD
jgi:hypothetical protein